ncbi:GNAT family N-acetyltransferase [Chloroflexi bacterium TSY]|nr:GNAT family N-acetyltransferase [Chloroflexi bacterium TSY]
MERRATYWKSVLSNSANVILVYEDDSEIVGFIDCGRSRDEDVDQDKVGEVYAIYLLSDVWSKGYGTALFDAALSMLREAGYEKVSLWALDGNERAIRFYRRFGLRPDGVKQVETHPSGVELSEARYLGDLW